MQYLGLVPGSCNFHNLGKGYFVHYLRLVGVSFQIVPVFKLSVTVSLKCHDQFILLKIDLHGVM